MTNLIKWNNIKGMREALFMLVLFSGFFTFGQTTIYSENFNGYGNFYPLDASNGSSWSAINITGSSGDWAIYNPTGTPSQCLEMYVGISDLVYSIGSAFHTVAYEKNLVNAGCYTSLTLDYKWAAGGEAGNNNDYLIPVYSTDNGVTWTNLGATQHHNSTGTYPAYVSVTNLDISVLDGQVFNIGFRWVNNGTLGTGKGPVVDDIVIKGVQPPCTGTPTIGIASANYDTGCSGKAVELVLNSETSTSCVSGLTYQWQSSANGSTGWTNIGQTNPVQAATTSTSTIYYRLSATCSNSGLSSTSNVLPYTAVACTDYPLNTTGTTVNTCLGMFYDNNVSGNYDNSQNRTITFCSDNGEHIMVDFFLFETQNNGLFGVNEVRTDILNVYDGNSAASPQLFSLSGGSLASEGEAPLIISSGTCLTFQFTSNNSTVDQGWEAMISCTDQQNNIASNYCASAPFICNLNGYQGSTTNFYNPESVGGQIGSSPSSFPGTLDNNSFIKFVPTSSTVTFDLEVSNCSGGITSTSGFYEAIQFAVYAQGSGGTCDLGAWVSDYDDVWDGIVPGNYTKTLSGLTVGATYYIVFDGLWGTVCDYKINVLSGITLPTIDIDEATICSGDAVTLTASGGSSYVWANGATTPSITVSNADVYQVVVSSGNPLCPDKTTLSSTILVDNCLPVTLTSFSSSCADIDEQAISWVTQSEHNSSYFQLERSIDGIYWTIVGQVNAAGNSTSNLSYSLMDNFRSISTLYYRLKQFDLNGEYQMYGPISLNCDNLNNEFSIFPNPSSDEISILLNASELDGDVGVEFYDLNGKVVKYITLISDKSQLFNVDIRGLESGVYFVRLVGFDIPEKSIKFVKY